MSTNPQHVDLRTRRTEAHLRRALVALMAERGYDGISVVDVCERAMVHRTTFYKHYAGKGDLLDDVVDDHLARLVGPDERALGATGHRAGSAEALRVLTEVFARAERDRSFWALLADEAVAAALTPTLTRALGHHLVGGQPAPTRGDARAALRAHLHAAIVVTTIAWTMRATEPLSPEELAQMLVDEFFERTPAAH